jgi:predicted DCC family thiol-disulfide oxidoreductase YuxK
LMPNRNWTLYYDGQCGMCRKLVRVLSYLDFFGQVDWVPYQSLIILPDGMTWTDFEGAAQLDVGIGRLVEGFNAFRYLTLKLIPLLPLAAICWLPGFDRIAGPMYRWVAKHRSHSTSCELGHSKGVRVPSR